MKKKVLVIATSRNTKGGITSVIEAHEAGEQWKRFCCKWIQTHKDGNCFIRIFYFIRAFICFMFYLPFYDIVHIHLSSTTSAIRKTFFFLLSWMLGKKIILHFHAFSLESSIQRMPKLYRFLFLHSDIVLVLSAYWKEVIKENIGRKCNVDILFNSCPTVNRNISRNASVKYILYAGAICARKGYLDLINAFAQIAHRYPDWKLYFAGNGTIDEGIEQVRNQGIESQVIFLGWINGETKETIFRNASIFCLPSYAEGFPMAILDAWAYGLPVITTPVGGIPDIADDGKNMLLFNPGDIDKLVEQLERMIIDKVLRDQISDASNILAKTIFNIDVVNSQLASIYSSL